MSDSTTDDRKHVADLVKNARVAMLTTMTEDGKHLSRPMGLQEVEFDGDLWFFAYDDSAKVAQIRAMPSVNVSFTDDKGHSWTSIAGEAQIVHDRAKAEQLWTPVLKAWFPDELETPGLTLIKVEADSAEYWEGPTSTVAFAAKNLRAAVTGDPKSDAITNDTVEL
ncbi:pyridoxamine 5'-phosphate oxidase family protein [Amnibacterium setariae]|uniref:Pyridoxamine 5'-phosphate oxidase n=1 Tax=Amnibacterium setariae TaxID=2306585 RepID=A0A3A1U3L1_9MICO|nr:pyridoxamine 5'-phosphate oxidase family protein [Amnibacterium setariae]RIX28427.1 pyridoxamine 5'-phosphate oxidase [Amnibacterium setariae]